MGKNQLSPKEQAKEYIDQCMNADINVPHAYSVHCASIIASEIILQVKKVEQANLGETIRYWEHVLCEINAYL
jgi:hypothetical protein